MRTEGDLLLTRHRGPTVDVAADALEIQNRFGGVGGSLDQMGDPGHCADHALPPPPIPVGFTTFPGEIWRTPRSWAEKAYPNLTYFNEVDRGGHFAAWEEPELFSEELRAAFGSIR
jgi:pimeloyl-ACP methyl ester carboxylesterase